MADQRGADPAAVKVEKLDDATIYTMTLTAGVGREASWGLRMRADLRIASARGQVS